MAVFPTIPGLRAVIISNDQPLTEYEDDDIHETLRDEPALLRNKAVSKYIESVTDQEFSVQLIVGAEYQKTSESLTYRISADGTFISGPIVTLHDFWVGREHKRTIAGPESFDTRTQTGLVHHMKFASIKTTLDENKQINIKDDIKRMSKLGTITIKVFRTTLPMDMEFGSCKNTLANSNGSEVHEKALKGQAKSHGISTGRTSKSTCRSSQIEYIDGKDSPIAVFYFHYRSLEALKQLCVIPRTPEPEETPLPSRPVKSSATQKSVKRERNDSASIKNEPGQPSAKRKKSKYKVTIDLTNDSDSDSDSEAGSVITID